MAVLEAIADSHHRVEDLRDQLDKVRHALDNTDAVLGVADNGLEIAEDVMEEARRAVPVIITMTALITAGAVGLYVYRRRRNHHESPGE
jgi:hypothetical protein